MQFHYYYGELGRARYSIPFLLPITRNEATGDDFRGEKIRNNTYPITLQLQRMMKRYSWSLLPITEIREKREEFKRKKIKEKSYPIPLLLQTIMKRCSCHLIFPITEIRQKERKS